MRNSSSGRSCAHRATSARSVRAAMLLGGSLSCLVSAGSALAQTSSSVPQTASGPIQEVVVTAQKRSENEQTVPLSIQVVSGKVLQQENYNTLQDLTESVPGVHISTVAQNSQLFIRGIGSGDINSFDQSVAMFDDDIYNGRSHVSGATFLDLSQMEILKGPQSIFFGNSAIAGALNIVSKQPGDAFDASGRILYGTYNQYAVEGAVTLPINDTLSVRVAGTANGGTGWIKNVHTGNDAPDENNWAGRVTALYKPTNDLSVTVKLEGSLDKTLGSTGGLPEQEVNCPTPPSILVGLNLPCALVAAPSDIPEGVHNDENTFIAGQYALLSTYDGLVKLNYTHWGQTFTSVTGYTEYGFSSRDGALLPFPAFQYTTDEHYSQFSQELRVASPTNQPLTYIAGAYFQTDKLVSHDENNVPYLNYIATFPGFGIAAPYEPFAVYWPFYISGQIYSAFGSASWNVTPELRINGGVRVTLEEKSGYGSNLFGQGTKIWGGWVPWPAAVAQLYAAAFGQASGGPSPTLKGTYRGVEPSASVQYQFTPDSMVYFKYDRGFKAGGFNGAQFFSLPLEAAYGPEYVDAYELGTKNKFFDDRLLVNADVFLSDYSDLQVLAKVYFPKEDVYGEVVRNAARSLSQGVELQSQWAVTDNLSLSANVTYLHSIYTKFTNASAQSQQTSCQEFYVLPACAPYPQPVASFANVSGQDTEYAPQWSGSFSVTYRVEVMGGYGLTASLTPYVTTSYYSDGANGADPFFRIPGSVRLDGLVTLQSPDRRWSLDLIGKNLTNAIILSDTSLNGASKEEPINFALQFRMAL